MTTIDTDLATLGLEALEALWSSPQDPPPTTPGSTDEYALWACTKYGKARTRTLIEGATVQKFQWPAVNAPAVAQFQVGWDDPNVGQLPVSAVPFAADDDLTHEVQIYRNGELLFWGPVVGRTGDSTSRTWQYIAKDPLWYLTGRFFGEANRRNYLSNSDFELDSAGDFPSDWNTSSNGFSGTADFEVDDVEFLTGQHSLRITDGVTFDNAYIGQILAVSAGAEGLAVIATGWVFVQEHDVNDTSVGLEVLQITPLSGTVIQQRNDQVDLATPARQWVRKTCAILLPPNTTSLVEVRCYGVAGVCNWDAVTLTTEESLSLISLNSPGGTGWDQVDIAKMIVRYASGAMPVGSPYTKSNVQLRVAGAVSGIKKSKTYQFFDAQAVYQGGTGSGALDEFFTASDGFDVRCEITETTRTAHFYYPAAGRTWPADSFAYARDVSGETVTGVSLQVVSHSWQETIEGQANRVRELGDWGTGAGREEGGGSLDHWGDLTLELVEAAPTGASLDLLRKIALARVAQLGEINRAPTLTCAEMRDPTTGVVILPLVGRLLPGDLMPTVIDDGDVQVDETVRATSVSFDCTTALLTVTIQLNTPSVEDDDAHAAPRMRVKASASSKRVEQRVYELERRILNLSTGTGCD